MKSKEIHTHRVNYTEYKTGKVKSFTCTKESLPWHLREVKKLNSNVTFESIYAKI